MTATIPARQVQRGHSIPGLDNAYVVEVDNDHYESEGIWTIVRTESKVVYASFDTEADAQDELAYYGEFFSIKHDDDDYEPEPYEITFRFHDANGEEGTLTVWSDHPITVDQTEPRWVGGF